MTNACASCSRRDPTSPSRSGPRFGRACRTNPAARLAALERDEPDAHGAVLLVVVGAYYTDKVVRERLHYPGQEAKVLQSWKYPVYLEEGLLDGVQARGAIWRDPTTGRTAIEARSAPTVPTEPRA